MRQESSDDYLNDLLNRIQNAADSTDKFFEIIDSVIKRTNRLSAYNALLVEIQCPGSNNAMPAGEWEKLARQPRPSAIPQLILWNHGPVAPVYEFSDTEPIPGREAEAVDLTPSFEFAEAIDDVGPYVDTLLARAYHFGIDPMPSRLGGKRAGDAFRSDRGTKIVIRPRREHHFKLRFVVRYNASHSPETQFQTLVHEYAHVLLGHLGPYDSDDPEVKWDANARARRNMDRTIKELEAEAVAYIVSKSKGVEGKSAEYLRTYVGNTLDGGAGWPRAMSLALVTKTANDIMNLFGNYSAISVKKKVRSSHPLGTTVPAPNPGASSERGGDQVKLFRSLYAPHRAASALQPKKAGLQLPEDAC
ncbi:ImmA/IrrE family metallo-endopeptidase [Corynebacterium sanguinis]|uniref:ImmA/IrrE family metallo-endopeptidase n=1 Tax=Corynebacterium sanguinis TaxID=2594913 RepID=UPI00223B2CF3|nr:ImmA/IrrE family metallo-endopeptidase [Corynebacterium sanguinis]MCT1413762.1 ImmA/IrrE family metallo-endopeptidase [Corynebacterium sanguinis]MCT1444858.1 ImmA/IrrE family metallo-endopeptidase [Corynebacterium sanguinis]MCT1462917.1 ImmA/IrrE family metallo-endopeptidase [Corynebacterium sanguinis]MCT1492577.1 ImmA/IrrE family metallo-endopeptidase [Corynebacterium sanguinis]MCT1498681.1 ImmA/IrrE family metallo-endopeptidase [Corynebacterium sanguinis]